jgi:hypothetical protein
MGAGARVTVVEPPFLARYRERVSRTWSDDTPIDRVRFVVLDSETTGLNPRTDRLITIGAVAVVGGEILLDDVFDALIAVEHNTEAVTVHGVTRDESRHGLQEADALERFLDYLGDGVIVGHHIGHDLLAMVVFGGMGSIAGAIAGAVFIGFTQEALRDFAVIPFGLVFGIVAAALIIVGVLIVARVIKTRAGPPYGWWLTGIGVVLAIATAFGWVQIPFLRIAENPDDWRLFILGLILVVVMVARPEGLIPSRRRAMEMHGEATASEEGLAVSQGPDERETPAARLGGEA